MNRPNPWMQVMGGIALLNVAMLVGGLHAPAWARYTGMAVCGALGVASIVFGVRRYFEKKPEKPKFQSRHRRGLRSGEPSPPGS
jgi:hypothetical protein